MGGQQRYRNDARRQFGEHPRLRPTASHSVRSLSRHVRVHGQGRIASGVREPRGVAARSEGARLKYLRVLCLARPEAGVSQTVIFDTPRLRRSARRPEVAVVLHFPCRNLCSVNPPFFVFQRTALALQAGSGQVTAHRSTLSRDRATRPRDGARGEMAMVAWWTKSCLTSFWIASRRLAPSSAAIGNRRAVLATLTPIRNRARAGWVLTTRLRGKADYRDWA